MLRPFLCQQTSSLDPFSVIVLNLRAASGGFSLVRLHLACLLMAPLRHGTVTISVLRGRAEVVDTAQTDAIDRIIRTLVLFQFGCTLQYFRNAVFLTESWNLR
jgi:hypothetical protein